MWIPASAGMTDLPGICSRLDRGVIADLPVFATIGTIQRVPRRVPNSACNRKRLDSNEGRGSSPSMRVQTRHLGIRFRLSAVMRGNNRVPDSLSESDQDRLIDRWEFPDIRYCRPALLSRGTGGLHTQAIAA